MNSNLTYVIVMAVLFVAAAGIYFMAKGPGMAIATTTTTETMANCCCEGPQGIFTVASGKLTSEATFAQCAMVCAKEGSPNTPITTIGTC